MPQYRCGAKRRYIAAAKAAISHLPQANISLYSLAIFALTGKRYMRGRAYDIRLSANDICACAQEQLLLAVFSRPPAGNNADKAIDY
jgi:hypothetical protein